MMLMTSHHPEPAGLLIVGTHPKCGKTVATAGLAGVLGQLGFRVPPIKPLHFAPPVAFCEGAYEQAYFDRVCPPVEPVTPLVVPNAQQLSARQWQDLVMVIRRRVYPYLLEMPGSAASPIRLAPDAWLDAVDLAQALSCPLLLVTSRQPDVIARLAPALAYFAQRSAALVGWMAVATTPPTSSGLESVSGDAHDWEQEVWMASQRYRVPYWGEIAHSPSISVELGQQGNLLRMTEQGVDVLPVQQALNLLIP